MSLLSFFTPPAPGFPSPGNRHRRQARAKINLSLRLIGKRDDGYHEIETRMAQVDLADELTIVIQDSGADSLTCSDTSLPVDDTNLVNKAIHAFRQQVNISGSVHVHLKKNIPTGAGLGGGSSDAAAILQTLNELYGEALDHESLNRLAAGIGSDVAFFLANKTCDCHGRGEMVNPQENWTWRLPVVLLKPPFPISTAWAYQQWESSTPLPMIPLHEQLMPWGTMVNDLERPVFRKYLLLGEIKQWLLSQSSVLAAQMSGSGSTMFAIPKTEAAGAQLVAKIKERYGATMWTCLTHTWTA